MSTTAESDPLYDALQARVGKNLTNAGPAAAPDTVNMPMIRHWVDALDDRNPVYEDEEYAAHTRFGGIIAPPAMLQAWTMPRSKLDGIRERGGAGVDIDPDSPLGALDRAGFTATLATNSELEFDRPLRLGDQLTSEVILEAVSTRKKTAMGQGYFVTWVTTYTDDQGQVVGRQRFRVLKFNPFTIGQ